MPSGMCFFFFLFFGWFFILSSKSRMPASMPRPCKSPECLPKKIEPSPRARRRACWPISAAGPLSSGSARRTKSASPVSPALPSSRLSQERQGVSGSSHRFVKQQPDRSDAERRGEAGLNDAGPPTAETSEIAREHRKLKDQSSFTSCSPRRLKPVSRMAFSQTPSDWPRFASMYWSP